ncbi:MAG TPA: tetratricopeptide repeat protein [Trichormus sp.]|jgi:thioredoxin-like negative regulator of GroEL
MCSSVPEGHQAPQMTAHSYPLWVKAFGVVVTLIFLSALWFVPGHLVAARELNHAEHLYKDGNTNDAIPIYEKLLKEHPHSDQVKINMAVAYFSLRDPASVKRAEDVLQGVDLDKDDWKHLKKVMPPEAKAMFQAKKDDDEDK